MKTAKEISSEWPEYDKMIALSQLTNYGVIYLDEYNLPIDDEYLLEELVLNTIANYINYYDTLENECKNNTEYTLKDLVDDIRELINQ